MLGFLSRLIFLILVVTLISPFLFFGLGYFFYALIIYEDVIFPLLEPFTLAFLIFVPYGFYRYIRYVIGFLANSPRAEASVSRVDKEEELIQAYVGNGFGVSS